MINLIFYHFCNNKMCYTNQQILSMLKILTGFNDMSDEEFVEHLHKNRNYLYLQKKNISGFMDVALKSVRNPQWNWDNMKKV